MLNSGHRFRRKRDADSRRSLLIILALLTATGCTAALKGYPDQSTDPKAELEALAVYLKSDVITKYDSTNPADRSGLSPQAWRNAVVDARLRACDLQFNEFQQKLYREGVGTGIGSDWIVLALTAAGALSGGAANALSAAAAGVTGARASFDKNAFFDKTLPALLATMVAKRKEVLFQIRQGESKSTEEYPLTVALNDVDSYYYAGSIPGALTDVAATAGAKVTAADKQLQDLKLVPSVGPVSLGVQTSRVKVAQFIRELESQNNKADLDLVADKLGVAKVDSIKEESKALILFLDQNVQTTPQISDVVGKIKSIPKFKDKEF